MTFSLFKHGSTSLTGTLDIRAGQTYYIKGTVGIGFLIGRPHLMVVPEDVTEAEISKCKLSPEKTEQ